MGGLGGGLLLRWAGDWNVPATVGIALGFVGALAGAIGGLGVGWGLALGESRARSLRPLVLMVCAAAGGGAIGVVAHTVGRWTIAGLFGRAIPAVGGGAEGLAIGALVGLAYGLSARPPQGSGLDAPARLRAAAATGLATAAGCVLVSLLGATLAGASLNEDRALVPGLAGRPRAARAPARRARPRPAHAHGARRVGGAALRRGRRVGLHAAPLIE